MQNIFARQLHDFMKKIYSILLFCFISNAVFSQEKPDTLQIKENIRKYQQLEAELKKRLLEKNITEKPNKNARSKLLRL